MRPTIGLWRFLLVVSLAPSSCPPTISLTENPLERGTRTERHLDVMGLEQCGTSEYPPDTIDLRSNSSRVYCKMLQSPLSNQVLGSF